MSAEDKRLTLINLDVARQNIPGGDAGLRQMAGVLDSECARLIDDLRDSKSADDSSKFRRAAHTLKSSAAVFGASTVADVARELEAIGKANNLSEAGKRLADLERLVAQLRTELDSIGSESPPL